MPAAETKSCPFCDEVILAVARKCRHCGRYLDEADEPAERARPSAKHNNPSTVERMLVPVGRPATAIIAGYCALFGILPGLGLPFAIAALVCGIMALKAIKKNPKLSGAGRAWFGIITGGAMTLLTLFVVIAMSIAIATGH